MEKVSSRKVPRCPCCSVELEIKYRQYEHDGVIELDPFLLIADTMTSLVVEAIMNSVRWIIRGKHLNVGSPEDRKEYVDLEKKTFRIQIFDSPEGDTWIQGEFDLNGPNLVVTKGTYQET